MLQKILSAPSATLYAFRACSTIKIIIFISLIIVFNFFSLLQEVEPNAIDNKKDISEMYLTKSNSFRTCGYSIQSCEENSASMSLEERQLLGRYGVWLLIGLCTPDKELPEEILGRLLSMLFHWFYITAYSFDGTKKSLIHLIFSVGNLNFTYILL